MLGVLSKSIIIKLFIQYCIKVYLSCKDKSNVTTNDVQINKISIVTIGTKPHDATPASAANVNHLLSAAAASEK